MSKERKKGGIILGVFILALFALPFSILSYVMFFAWDSQLEGRDYKLGFEKNNQIYETNLHGNSVAFDKDTQSDSLYLNSPYNLAELIAFGYENYEIRETDNPFFAGKIYPKKTQNYYEQENKFVNAKDSVQIYRFYDESRNLIFAYEPEMQSEFVVKLRPTFPAFSKRKYSIGTHKQDYINATKLLNEKLGKKLRIRTDETNKLLILSIQ